ncbi:MAG: hypothetical protein KKF62_12185 [Bacteroidetes bacterium]|nr:hypothetical protein [Bacteroidota bacterium]MBU1116621.1 hypothetical protein [Bacteroidota bacterium]MBU1797738.1 hypothetical protein [Bacteroidota bacterium]
MTKTTKYYLLIIILFSSLVFGQTDTPKMPYFRGGNLNFSAGFVTNFFGGGNGSGLSGGIVAPLMQNESSSIFINPSELAFVDAPYFNFNYRLGIGSSSIVDQASINSSTDEYLKDTTMFIYDQSVMPEYTHINNSDVSQIGGFSSLSFAFPIWKDYVVSFGYNIPLAFNIAMTTNGIETKLATTQDLGGNETTFDMVLNTTVSNITKLNMSEVVFGFGTSIFNNEFGYLSTGLSLSRFEVVNKMNLNLMIDGLVVLNGSNEYYFNQPDDILLDKNLGERNDFYWKVNGVYRDTKYGGKIAFYYNPSKNRSSWANFSLVYDLKPTFVMSDEDATNISFRPKFMMGRLLGEDEDALDLNLDSMNLAKPHLTVEKDNISTKEISLSIPSSLTLGFDAAVGEHSLSLNLIKYFGKLSYDYAFYKFGKEATIGIKIAGNFKMNDKMEGWDYALIPVRLLFLDIDGLLFQAFANTTHYKNPYYRVGAGLMFGAESTEGLTDSYSDVFKDIFNLPLPNGIALSRKYTIFDKIDVGVLVFGMPSLALKFSLGYNL